MFDNSLRKRIDKIEAKLWDVENPNGEVFKETDSCGRIYDELRFRYFYNWKIYVADLSFPYSVSFHPCDIDYAKTSMGYIFTNRHRTFWILVKYGSKKAIEIPKPCFCE